MSPENRSNQGTEMDEFYKAEQKGKMEGFRDDSVPEYLRKYATVSAVLHFLCVVVAIKGIYSPTKELDLDLIHCGISAYIYDVLTAIVFQESFFYRWTLRDVFTHHLPFMFVGGLWYAKTYHDLIDQDYVVAMHAFQSAVRWAMLSCANECSLAAAAALAAPEHNISRMSSTIIGLIYFGVCSPVWVIYSLYALFYAFPAPPVSLIVNIIIPVAYAVSEYPIYIKVYYRRLVKLIKSEKVGKAD